MKKPIKTFVVRKYIQATSAIQAIRKEKEYPVYDVWLSEKQENKQELPPAIGFTVETEADEW